MANPETCLHRVVFAGFNRFELSHFIVCSSCGTDVTDRSNHINKMYRYDVSTDVWVYIGKREVKQGGQGKVDGDNGLPDVRSEQSRSRDEQRDGSD